MNDLFRIAGQNIRITDGSLCRLLFGFEASAAYENDPNTCQLDIVPGDVQFDIRSYTPTHEVAHVFASDSCEGHFMMANADYSRATVFMAAKKAPPAEEPRILTLTMQTDLPAELLLAFLYSRLAYTAQAVFVHASLVELPDLGGVMFVGRSGIGKTTQARLWQKYQNASIINGDKVFLTLEDGRVWAHGSPWCGSSFYRLNRSVPLCGIVVLDQAPENRIRRLSDLEIMAQYVPHIFLPMWDEHLTDRVMGAIGDMMPLVPVFRLACRPDEEATILAREAIFGGEAHE